MEKWCTLNKYPMYYFSTLGNVRHIYSIKNRKIIKDKKGYCNITIRHNNKMHKIYIHKIIALLNIPNPDNLPQVNHKDGNKQNNSIDNLEWCTAKQNIQHAHATGIVNVCKGSNQHMAKITEEQVNIIRTEIVNGKKQKDIAKYFNVSPSLICNINKGRTWKHVKKP